MLHLERGFLMVLKLGRFGQQIRNTSKFRNVVLEEDGED